MATRNVPNGVSHAEDRQAESQRDAHEGNSQVDGRGSFVRDELRRENGAAAPAENKPERPQDFRDQPILQLHVSIPFQSIRENKV
jgi:hypothetical protein